MSRAIPLEGLGTWLVEEIGPGGPDVAVLAGHFAIFSAGATAGDLLDDATPPVAGAGEMLDFTRVTWRAACEAAAVGPRGAFRTVLLADDVQFVRPQLNDRGLSERLAAALASDYFAAVPRLPSYHTRELAARGLPEACVLRASPARWVHSERQLRIDAVRHMRQLDGAGAGLIRSEDGSTMNVQLAEGGEYCLVHSGRTSCVGGYIELLSRLYTQGVRKFIAMVPMRCLGQIALGTDLAPQLFPLPGFDVVNVAVPDPAVGLPAHVVPARA